MVLVFLTHVVTEHVRKLQSIVIIQILPSVNVREFLNVEATLPTCSLFNELIVERFTLSRRKLLPVLLFNLVNEFVGLVLNPIEVLGLIEQT
ncbi:hypothetical protein D3C78_1302000 [compost metagenome]